MSKKIRFRVYEDPQTKNRFVIYTRNHCIVLPDEDGCSLTDVICESMMWSVIMGVKIPKDDEGWLDVDLDEESTFVLPHVVVDLHSRALLHGGCTIWVISGPIFDEAMALEKEEADAGTDVQPDAAQG